MSRYDAILVAATDVGVAIAASRTLILHILDDNQAAYHSLLPNMD